MSLVQPNRLLGRSAETSILSNVYFASLSLSQDSPAPSVLIHGDSGLGKTRLAETLGHFVLEDDGYFMRGKFDQLSYASAKRPHSTIAAAFTEFCSSVERGDPETRRELAAKLREAIGKEERSLLFEVIPALQRILGDGDRPADGQDPHNGDDPTNVPDNFESNHRSHKLFHLIRKFVSVISSGGDPIVMLLDDLQWANKEELELLHHIMLSVKNPFTFIFTCRKMDVNQARFSEKIVSRTDIHLGGLGRDSVGDLVSETGGKKKELSSFIYNVTTGNPFFVQQIISFREKKLLWDNVDIMEEAAGTLDTDVMSILSEKIRRLPLVTQQALKICSCIGSRTDLYILGLLLRGTLSTEEFNNNTIETIAKEAISNAAQEDVVILSCDEEISFTHDSFAEASYSLQEPGERAAFHLKLGKILLQKIGKHSEDQFQKYLFTIAVQLAQGRSLIEETDRIATIRIFLAAGDKSNSTSAFPVALSWYSFCISLLREQDWGHHRRLCVSLYLKAADVSSITGDYENMNSWLAIIFDRCTDSVADLLNAYYIRVRKLAAKDEDPRALDVGLEALSLVDISFPKKITSIHTMGEFTKTYCSLKRKGGATKLIKLPLITESDVEIVIALRLLDLLTHVAVRWNQELLPLFIFKSVNLNLSHGVSPQIPRALASFGTITLRFGLPIKSAYLYGEAAIALQQTICSSDACPHVTIANHAGSFPFIRKFSDCLIDVQTGWDSGFAKGDVVHAMACAEYHGWLSLFTGKPLREVARSMIQSSSSMKEYNTTASLHAIAFHQRATATLLGDSARIQQTGVYHDTEENNLILDGQAKLDELLVSVFLNNNEHAWTLSEKLHNFGNIFRGSIWCYIASFYRGMSAFAMLHLLRNRRMRKTAKLCLNHLRKGKKRSPLNLSHQSYILEAENAVYLRKYDSAEKYYALAIKFATGVTHEHALACERFGSYYILRKDHSKAYEQIRAAYKLYSKWGSRPKCNLLKKNYPHLSDKVLKPSHSR